MKLKTKKSFIVFLYCLCGIFISPMTSFASSKILDVQVYDELTGRPFWCWAACGSSVLYHYGIYITESEICEFVNQTWGLTYCCTPGECNTGAEFGNVAYTLEYYQQYPGSYAAGIISEWFPYDELSWSEVQQEINSGKPFMIGWEQGANGHAIIGCGYDTWGTGYVWYMDPNEDDLQSNTYTWVKNYSNWTWSDSLKMTSTPPAICESDSDGDLQIGLFDLLNIRNEFGTTNCDPSSQTNCCCTDFNEDGGGQLV